MKKVMRFATLEEAKQFTNEHEGFKLTMVFTTNGKQAEKIFIAYDKKKCPPLNNALIEYWMKEGLI